MKKWNKPLALALALSLSLAVPAFAQEASPFPDVPTSHWAIEYIRQASQDGIIQGMGDGTFAPNDELTAAQFATIVAQAFYWREMKELKDVPDAPWYARYQKMAEEAGLMEGTGVEDWNAPMTRYQMAAMLYNITKDLELEPPSAGAAAMDDLDQIPEQYKEAVKSAYQLGLLSGMDDKGTFAGDRTLTRTQAAVIYSKLEGALLKVQGPMERALQKAEREMFLNNVFYIFTRHPGKLGTAYEASRPAPHGGRHWLCYVAMDGTELSIRDLLPKGYTYGSFWSLDPRGIQIDETGEKLSFVTNVQEQIQDPTATSGFLEGKDWGDTLIVIDVVTGTVESMTPLSPQG